MGAFIDPPKNIPFFLKIGIWISRRITGKDLLVAKILSWYPKAAIGSALLESLVAHSDSEINERILKIVRIQASFSASCPFCIDMNSFEAERKGITNEELRALQGHIDINKVSTFSKREKIAIEYTKYISKSPLYFPKELITELRKSFNEREIVILASTAAQVNYWARLIQALGIPPAGFSDKCSL
jgi:Uncharacterized conserved protein